MEGLTPEETRQLSKWVGFQSMLISGSDLASLLGDWERMREALEAIRDYSRETRPPHQDHEGLSDGLESGQGCILCLIEAEVDSAFNNMKDS